MIFPPTPFALIMISEVFSSVMDPLLGPIIKTHSVNFCILTFAYAVIFVYMTQTLQKNMLHWHSGDYLFCYSHRVTHGDSLVIVYMNNK